MISAKTYKNIKCVLEIISDQNNYNVDFKGVPLDSCIVKTAFTCETVEYISSPKNAMRLYSYVPGTSRIVASLHQPSFL